MLVAGNRADLSDIQAENRFGLWWFRQLGTALFAVSKLREGEGLTGRALDRFWFRRFTATAVWIT